MTIIKAKLSQRICMESASVERKKIFAKKCWREGATRRTRQEWEAESGKKAKSQERRESEISTHYVPMTSLEVMNRRRVAELGSVEQVGALQKWSHHDHHQGATDIPMNSDTFKSFKDCQGRDVTFLGRQRLAFEKSCRGQLCQGDDCVGREESSD